MFITDADMSCLRQGDILVNIPFPQLVSSRMSFLGSAALDGVEPIFTAQTKTERNQPMYSLQLDTRLSTAVVISQCCTLEPREGSRITAKAIALARLVPVPKEVLKNEERLAELRLNSDPRKPGAQFVNVFWIAPHEKLGNREWIVDYAQVCALPAGEFPAILSRKALQMTDDSRIRFKTKLASSFARLTDEERCMDHSWLSSP